MTMEYNVQPKDFAVVEVYVKNTQREFGAMDEDVRAELNKMNIESAALEEMRAEAFKVADRNKEEIDNTFKQISSILEDFRESVLATDADVRAYDDAVAEMSTAASGASDEVIAEAKSRRRPS